MELFYSSQVELSTLRLSEEESGHCVRVLRHRAGDEISVIDGKGCLYRCRLTVADHKAAEAEILSREEGFGSHPYRLTMAVCPTKNIDRYEWFIEKATEIGLDEIVPVIRKHSERKVVKTDRLRRIVLSAAKQSLKADVPEVAEACSIKDFIESCPESKLKLIAYCDETLDRDKRMSVLDALKAAELTDDPREIAVLIGPEGDFSEDEVALALSRGWLPVHLGNSRLRTETAALVAVTAVYFSLSA